MSADQNRANSAVSRGGTGAVATPANATHDPQEGRTEYASGRRDRPDVARGAGREGFFDKFTRTSDTGIGKDTSSKATSIPQRLGFDRPIDKAVGAVTEVKEEGKGMFAKAQQQLGTPPSIPRSSDRRRRSSLMSGKDLTNDFLSNYSYEIKSENGEPDGLERNFDSDRRITDPMWTQKF